MSRFEPDAALALRRAIAEAGGIEVFAVGTVGPNKTVVAIEIHARGTEDAVNALRSRPRSGQVVIHNHPSGVLRPSEPDMELAHRFGEDGVGFIIVDNDVTRAQWVVEPMAKKRVAVDPLAVQEIFRERLPHALGGWEPRPGQIEMSIAIAETLSHGGVSVLEAGTGTGKSLAYLVPAVLWALANDGRVVVSTYTRTLQGQLVAEDLPTLARALDFRYAILKGRNNYVCRRKMEMAGDDPAVEALRAWASTSSTGDVSEAGFEVDADAWDRVESDTDQTLRARCPHFNQCFYYQARRKAAAAHVIVVNHALLLSDMAIKRNKGAGILPDYDRVILDEAHHLEEAATSTLDCRLSGLTIARAVTPMLGRRGRPGALESIGRKWPEALPSALEAQGATLTVRDQAGVGFDQLGEGVSVATRVRGAPPDPEFFKELGRELERVAARLGAVRATLEGVEVKPADVQPILDLDRARHRLEEAASAAFGFVNEDPAWCRYLDPGKRGVAAARAPVDVAEVLHSLLAEGMESAILTSATLAVHNNADHYLARVGLSDAVFRQFPSPFDYQEQAVLALPKDLPAPDKADFVAEAGKVIVAAIEASRGGAFVLCTSHAAVQDFADYVEAALGTRHAILRQGRGGKGGLLERFRDDRGAVLFGTDSFWEGVSVRGDGLRLVIIPRLPFRVPTEPVSQARHERIKEQGLDPFRAWSLPEAILKLRQGFGRLIRSRTDRGAVMVLDRRIHEMWYGRLFLASLPNAPRLVGPSRAVIEGLGRFYSGWV